MARNLNLYDIPLPDGLPMQPKCGGNNDDNGDEESCMTFGRIPGHADAFVVGDSKRPDATPFRYTGAELRAAGIDTTTI